MKHSWQLRRQTVAYPDGQKRWDRAYQLLLAGSQSRFEASEEAKEAAPIALNQETDWELKEGRDE